MKTVYQLTLTEEQLKFLTDGDSMDTRFGKFIYLIKAAKLVDTDYSAKVKKVVNFRIPVGHVGIPMTQLAQIWDCDRKTAISFVKQLEKLGLAEVKADHQTTLVNLLCIAGWFDGDKVITNPNYIPLKQRLKPAEVATDNGVEQTASGQVAQSVNEKSVESATSGVQPSDCNSNDVEQVPTDSETSTTEVVAEVDADAETDHFDDLANIPEPPADLFIEASDEAASDANSGGSDVSSVEDEAEVTAEAEIAAESVKSDDVGDVVSSEDEGAADSDAANSDSDAANIKE